MSYSAGRYRPKGFTMQQARNKYVRNLSGRTYYGEDKPKRITRKWANEAFDVEERDDDMLDLRKITRSEKYQGLRRPARQPKQAPMGFQLWQEFMKLHPRPANMRLKEYLQRLKSEYGNEWLQFKAQNSGQQAQQAPQVIRAQQSKAVIMRQIRRAFDNQFKPNFNTKIQYMNWFNSPEGKATYIDFVTKAVQQIQPQAQVEATQEPVLEYAMGSGFGMLGCPLYKRFGSYEGARLY